MTEAQKPVQPVTAWAVVDKDGVFTRQDLIDAGGPPHHSLEWYNSTYPSRAPHRVIKVEIGPKGFAARITALEAREAALVSLLCECEDYFDNRADADMDQDGYIPNEEMKMLTAIRALLSAQEGK